MRFIWLSVALVLSAYHQCFTQDTLVYIDEISFFSDVEKEVILANFDQEDKDYISLFLVSDIHMTRDGIDKIKKRISNGHKTLLDKNVQNLSGKKQIKKIFKIVHELFLHKYDERAEFHEIFKDGRYNCVTAVALFAIYFNKLEIPYVINQTPVHVYLLTYPDTDRVLVETTNPVNGYLAYKPLAKRMFVENLYKNKFISADEYNSKSITELFDTYFFTDDQINLDQLVGIHFHNLAVLALENKEYKKAYQWAEKSILFYPMEQSQVVMLSSAAQFLDNSIYDSMHDVEILAKLSRYEELGISGNDVVQEYLRIINAQLINKGKLYYFKDISEYLIAHLEDSTMKSDVSFYYNYEIARYYYNKGNYEKAFTYGEKAVHIRASNNDAQSLFVHSMIQKLQNESNQDSIISRINALINSHDFLKNNELLSGFKLQSYLMHSIYSFESNKRREAEKSLQLFENDYSEKYLNNLDKDLIARAYLSAAMYYFRKYNTSKAKQVLKKGLIYVPNNFELRRRLNQISTF